MINEASETYRPAASRGALVFFMMNELYKIHSFYMFSLDSFVIVINRAIDIVAEEMNPKKKKPELEEGEEGEVKPPAEEGAEEQAADDDEDKEDEEEEPMTPRTLKKRVEALCESIMYQGFNYTRRGLLEKDKLLVASLLCFRIMIKKGIIIESEVNALIKKEVAMDLPHQIDSLKFIPEAAWAAIAGL
jgi:dynein heavy chain